MAWVASPYLTSFGRGFAVSIDFSRIGKCGNFLRISGSEYRSRLTCAWEVASVSALATSSDDMNLMKSAAVPLLAALVPIARLWPPRLVQWTRRP